MTPFHKLNVTFILYGLLVWLPGCGLNEDEALDDSVAYSVASFESACKMEPDRLKKILEENLEKELNCVEDNLKQFTDFVRREDARYIKKDELSKFIRRFFPETGEDVNEILNLVFNLNSLLLKDPADKVSVTNMKLLFKLFHVVNTEGLFISKLIKSLDKFNYWEKREELKNGLNRIVNTTLGIIMQKFKDQTRMDIHGFLTDIRDTLGMGEADFDIELIESYLFVKKLAVGGERKIITSDEFEEILAKVPEMVILMFDLQFVETKKFEYENSKSVFYLTVIERVNGLLFELNENEVIIEHVNLSKVLQRIFLNKYSVEEMEASILKFKEKFLGGDPEIYTFRDFLTIKWWAQDLLERFYFNGFTYDHFRPQLETPVIITDLVMPDLYEYKIFDRARLEVLWQDFKYIAITYRHFKDTDGFQFYNDKIARFRPGFDQTTLLRWAFKKIFGAYGRIEEGHGSEYVANEEDLSNVMEDYEGLLRELGIFPEDVPRFINEALMSSDLFQPQSNGDLFIGQDELTEYANVIFSSHKLSKNIRKYMKEHCPFTGEDGASFDVPCYRQYFYKVMFEELGYQKYFSRWHEYTKKNAKEAQDYLVQVESYARIKADEKLPLDEEDMVRLLISLADVEETILRYDINRNNFLDRSELDPAYELFKKTLIKVAKIEPDQVKFAPSVFLYLVKNMKPPTPVQLALFHYLGNKKKIVAQRVNIGAILANLSAAATGTPPPKSE